MDKNHRVPWPILGLKLGTKQKLALAIPPWTVDWGIKPSVKIGSSIHFGTPDELEQTFDGIFKWMDGIPDLWVIYMFADSKSFPACWVQDTQE